MTDFYQLPQLPKMALTSVCLVDASKENTNLMPTHQRVSCANSLRICVPVEYAVSSHISNVLRACASLRQPDEPR